MCFRMGPFPSVDRCLEKEIEERSRSTLSVRKLESIRDLSQDLWFPQDKRI